MSTTEEAEKPAKIWQVDSINEKLVEVNKKLDILVTTHDEYVTHKELLAALANTQNIIDTKYGPLYKMFWALVTALFVQAGLLAFQLVRG